MLFGNLGDDYLISGSGYDQMRFAEGFGNDTIGDRIDFVSSSLRDLVYIQSNINGTGISSGVDVLSRLADNSSGQAVLDLDNGDSITFEAHSTSWFISSDFIIF